MQRHVGREVEWEGGMGRKGERERERQGGREGGRERLNKIISMVDAREKLMRKYGDNQ